MSRPDSEFAVHSMTGFGIARGPLNSGPDAPHVEVALKSVNHRYLKVGFRLPDALSPLERAIEDRLRARLARGAVQCTVRVRKAGTLAEVLIDEARAANLAARLSSLAGQLGLQPPTIDLIASLPGVIAGEAGEAADETETREHLLRIVDAAVDQLLEMRRQEGTATALDLDRRCQSLAILAERAGQRSPEVVREVQRRLTERLEELLGGQQMPADSDQVAREVALFADRSDISEEVARLRHHTRAMHEHLRKPGEVGRRLDFIAQEMLREANTIGSKGNDAELASIVVEMKAEVEKIKEQVQNLE